MIRRDTSWGAGHGRGGDKENETRLRERMEERGRGRYIAINPERVRRRQEEIAIQRNGEADSEKYV